MSMKKLSKKMLAVVAAGAMTMGLAMPTFAADPLPTQDTKNNAKEAYIKKTYNTEVKKEMTFTFVATQVKEATRDDLVKEDLTCTIPSIKFETTDFASEAGTYTKLSDKIIFGKPTEAGKYEYTVKEGASSPAVTNSEHEKLIMSQAEYKMDVYVVEKTGGALEIDKILVTKTKNDQGKPDAETGKVDIGGNVGSNGFNFTNTYAQEAGTGKPDPDPDKPIVPGTDYNEYGSLNVAKKVILNTTDATASIPTEKFDFTVKFDFPEGTDKDTLGGVKDKDGKGVTITNGETKFQLAHDENMKFTGLPVGTTITVTEAAKANYKASAKVTLNGVEQTAVAASKYNAALTEVDQQKLGQNKNTVDVTNRFNNVPTTGIIMNTLPYVLMIALCGAALFGFVAFKRRR